MAAERPASSFGKRERPPVPPQARANATPFPSRQIWILVAY